MKSNYCELKSDWFFDFILNLKTRDEDFLWKNYKFPFCCSILNDYLKNSKELQMNDVINSPNNWNIFVGEIFENKSIKNNRNNESNMIESENYNHKYSHRFFVTNPNIYLKFRMLNLLSLDLSRFQKERIREINLDFNRFKEIPKVILNLPFLEKLSMIKNKISSLNINQVNNTLMVLLLGNNKIYRFSDIKVISILLIIQTLSNLNNLMFLDLSQNPIQIMPEYRLFIKHICTNLLFLDSKFYVNIEIQKSKEIFKGRLTQDLIKSKILSIPESKVKKLVLDSSGLCHYDKELNLK